MRYFPNSSDCSARIPRVFAHTSYEHHEVHPHSPTEEADVFFYPSPGAAPDIFTQAAALAASDTPDLALAMSESIGAGLFVATVGKALAIFVGLGADGNGKRRRKQPIANNADCAAIGAFHVTPSSGHDTPNTDSISVASFPYMRDASAYGGLLFIAVCSVTDGVVSLFESSLFVIWYALYVVAVMKGEAFYETVLSGGSNSFGIREDTSGGRDGLDRPGQSQGLEMLSRRKEKEKGVDRKASPRVFAAAADLESVGVGFDSGLGETAGVTLRERRPRTTNEWTATGASGDEDGGGGSDSGEDGDASDDEARTMLVGEIKSDSHRRPELSAARILRHSGRRASGGNFKGFGGNTTGRENREHVTQQFKHWCYSQSGLGEDADGTDDDADEIDETVSGLNQTRRKSNDAPNNPQNAKSIGSYVGAPIVLCMSLTMISVVPKGNVTRVHLATVCVLSPVFASRVAGIWRDGRGDGVWWFVFVCWTVAVCLFVVKKIPPTGLNPRRTKTAHVATFVTGILWMNLLADELVGVFQAFGRIAGVRESLLGATVMAWGASAGDLGGMLAMARAGFVKTAITASLAGPLCQLAMGTGFSMLLVKLNGKTIESDLSPNLLFFMWWGVVFVCSYYAIYVPTVLKFTFTKTNAVAIITAYAVAVLIFAAWGFARGGEE